MHSRKARTHRASPIAVLESGGGPAATTSASASSSHPAVRRRGSVHTATCTRSRDAWRCAYVECRRKPWESQIRIAR